MSIFGALRTRTKMTLLVGLSAASLLAASATAAWHLRAQIERDERSLVRAVVQSSHAIAMELEARVAAGSLSREEALDRFKASLRAMRFQDGREYLFAYTLDGVNLVHPVKPELEGKNLIDFKDPSGRPLIRELAAAARDGGGFVPYLWPKPGSDRPVAKVGYAQAVEPWGLFVGSGVYVDDLEARFAGALRSLAAAILGMLVVSGAVAALIGRDVARTLGRLADAMRRLAAGDLSVAVAGTGRRDEIGDMARAIEVFRGTAIEAERLRAEQDAMKQAAEADRRRQLLDVADRFEAEVRGVVAAVSASATQMRASSEGMSVVADQTRQQASTVAVTTEQASANVQTVAAATEQLSAAVREIGHQTGYARSVAGRAVEAAGRTDALIASLREEAVRIDEVAQLIAGVASKTSLLSLNATIEAMRAGEAGRGFSVVATEVKALAAQTREATEQIGCRIRAIQDAARTAAEGIDEIRGVIHEINGAAAGIAGAVEQQGAATGEIVRNVHEAARGTEVVSCNIAEVSRAAQETGSAAAQVLSAAGALSAQSDMLADRIGRFVARLRAA
ncbi:MAG TPA: methyl-accepting chemotaxis protein [Azospirillaceae bacterium]|nr:methyl-accepting chemotaxis protein [Azospirillaceae bacterium]